MKELIDYFKFLVPIATFGLGVWAAPLIEARKEKAKARSVHKNLMLEIEDELEELPTRLIKMAGLLESLISLKAWQPEIDKPCKYVPRSTSLYFLKAATEISFSLFNKEQRYAIKSLFVQMWGLDRYLQAISDTEVSDETLEECIKNCKRYLYTGACMLNTMRIIASKPGANLSGEDRNIIDGVFSELGIQLTTEDLRIISQVEFKKLG